MSEKLVQYAGNGKNVSILMGLNRDWIKNAKNVSRFFKALAVIPVLVVHEPSDLSPDFLKKADFNHSFLFPSFRSGAYIPGAHGR